ncbi:hypothetical protein ACGF0K_35985 [Streptomyces sp. NPDC048156]|uniref:hypothetical protein n=1 Tax=Streptomyces sp. NPDC048156 TaxID=3365502 RepID=UPI0037231209
MDREHTDTGMNGAAQRVRESDPAPEGCPPILSTTPAASPARRNAATTKAARRPRSSPRSEPADQRPIFPHPDNTPPESVTIVVTPEDDPQFMRMAFAAHRPRLGHITVHPTPFGGEGVHLAHDLIRSFGKHLPLPDDRQDRLSRLGGIADCWRIAAAWSLAMRVNRLTVCRAHLLRLPKWRNLLEFSTATSTRLTLVCNNPIPREVLPLLDVVPHRILASPETAAAHWQTSAGLQELEGHPWWLHQAAFPPPDDEPWFRPPPQPRRRLTIGYSFQPASAEQQPQPRAFGQGHYDIAEIADRIHTRIAHPVFAACAAVRALTGHRPHQIPAFYEDSSIRFPSLPPWAAFLMDAARHLIEVGGSPGISSRWLLTVQEDTDIDKALRDCRLLTD